MSRIPVLAVALGVAAAGGCVRPASQGEPEVSLDARRGEDVAPRTIDGASEPQGSSDAASARDVAPAADARGEPVDAGGAGGDAPTVQKDAGALDAAGAAAALPTLPGAVMILDPSKGITVANGKISRWADQSGRGNDAKNGNGGFQPELVDVAGTPAVRFSGKRNPTGKSNGDGHGGTFLRVLDSDSLHFGTDDWLIEVVVAYKNSLDASHNGVLGALVSKWGNDGEILFTGNWPWKENPNVEQACVHLGFGEESPVGIETRRGSGEKDPGHPLNDGKVRVLAARRFGSSVEVRINGKSDTVEKFPNNPNFSLPGTNIGIGSAEAGSDTNSQRSLEGDIYFVYVHKGKISDADLTSLETALVQRFNAAP